MLCLVIVNCDIYSILTLRMINLFSSLLHWEFTLIMGILTYKTFDPRWGCGNYLSLTTPTLSMTSTLMVMWLLSCSCFMWCKLMKYNGMRLTYWSSWITQNELHVSWISCPCSFWPKMPLGFLSSFLFLYLPYSFNPISVFILTCLAISIFLPWLWVST